MKKFTKSLFGIVAGLSVAIAGVSPAFADEGDPRKIVTFVDEGTTVSQQIVYDDDCLYEPEALGKDGYVFMGWFDGDEEADFWTCDQTVSEDLETKTYTAKYVEADLRVNFMASEDTLGTTVFSSQKVAKGGNASEPTSKPERAGYEVTAWADKDGNEFDFSTAITENIDLYPIFSPAETVYKVFVYKENEDDEGAYTLVDDDELTGLTGSEISLSEDEINAYLSGLKNGAYYELDKTEGDTTVKADGTSAVKIYFKRKTYTIILKTNNNWYSIFTGTQNRTATYTVTTTAKIGASVFDWATSVRSYPYSNYNVVNFAGWKLDGGDLILTPTQNGVYTAEMLGDGSETELTYNLVTSDFQWVLVSEGYWNGYFYIPPRYEYRDINAPNQEEDSVESDDEIELEENEAETDPVYVIVQIQFIDYDYAGVANIHTDEYKFVRGEGGLALVPGYTGEYPEDTDSFVGWTAYDDFDLPYQAHHSSVDYFFENGLINLDAFADVFCEAENEDCLIRFFAAFDYAPEDGWFQEIEEEEEVSEEENPETLDDISNVVMIAILATAGLGAALVALKKESKEA